MARTRDNYTFLTQAPIPRVVLTMSVSTIISMLVTSLYNLADTFFVGQIDTQSTAAVGIVFPVMFIMQAVGFFFGHGSGNYISRELGAKRHLNAQRMAATGFVSSVAAGLAIMAVGLAWLRPISAALGSTPTILPRTIDYLGTVLLGAPFFTGSLTLNNQMRFQGNAAYAMLGIVTGAVLNVALDPVFIFGLGMGVKGAALATVVGQVSSFAILLVMTRRGGNLRMSVRKFTASRQFAREIVSGGMPSLLRQGLGCVATMIMNVVAARYGDAAIAAMSIVGRISMFVMSFIVGLGQGYQPMCGFCYGARLYGRVRGGLWFCVWVGTAFLTVVTVLGFLFSGGIIQVFRNDPQVIAIGTRALRWQLASFPICALSMYANMMLQTIGMTWRANVLAAARRGIFFLPLIMVLPLALGLEGVLVAQPLADVCTFLLAVPILHGALKHLK